MNMKFDKHAAWRDGAQFDCARQDQEHSFEQPPATPTSRGSAKTFPGRIHDRHCQDIPGEQYVALILNDQPYPRIEIVNHHEEPSSWLAHRNKYLLEEARVMCG